MTVMEKIQLKSNKKWYGLLFVYLHLTLNHFQEHGQDQEHIDSKYIGNCERQVNLMHISSMNVLELWYWKHYFCHLVEIHVRTVRPSIGLLYLTLTHSKVQVKVTHISITNILELIKWQIWLTFLLPSNYYYYYYYYYYYLYLLRAIFIRHVFSHTRMNLKREAVFD